MLALGGGVAIAPAFVPRGSLMGMPSGLLVSRRSSLARYGFDTPMLSIFGGDVLIAELEMPFSPAGVGRISAAPARSRHFPSLATAIADRFELTNRSGVVALTGSAGVGGDLSLDNAYFTPGQPVMVTSFELTDGNNHNFGLKFSPEIRNQRMAALDLCDMS